MGGGLMQLVAYGAQDVYLTGNPQITFWKVPIVVTLTSQWNLLNKHSTDKPISAVVSHAQSARNGDLAYRTYLQVTLPEINQAMANTEVVFMLVG